MSDHYVVHLKLLEYRMSTIILKMNNYETKKTLLMYCDNANQLAKSFWRTS